MRGRPAAEACPSRPGAAVAVLALLGLAPPVAIVGPQFVAIPVGIARPDVEPEMVADATARPAPHTCRCGDRTQEGTSFRGSVPTPS